MIIVGIAATISIYEEQETINPTSDRYWLLKNQGGLKECYP